MAATVQPSRLLPLAAFSMSAVARWAHVSRHRKTLYSWLDRISDFNADDSMPEAVPETASAEAAELLGVPETFTPVGETPKQDKADEPVHTSEADVFKILESVKAAEEAKDTKQEG